jgi:adsorption protein B
LNWIVKAIFLHEKQHNMQFAGVILHDSEDVLHPLELQLFNYMLPRMDMVQLPVMSLEREWHELVAGTYMDEFAEWHGKDMQVRESMSNVVPSAGVGTCFSRRALMALSANSHDEPFNTRSLTEDYEVGAHLSRLGMKQIFAMFPVQFQVRRRAWFGLRPDRDLTVSMPLCVREYFPNTFKTAYRQRARWTLGIGLQSWETIAWRGSLAARYILLRDRKGIVTAFISILAYLLVVQLGLFLAAKHFGLWTVYYPSIFTNSTWFNTLITFNLGAMIWRAFSRAYFVNKLYGWEHAIMSVPRMVVGNFINFMAVARAWRMFMAYLFKGRAMAWDKTMHDFPSEDRLGQNIKNWAICSRPGKPSMKRNSPMPCPRKRSCQCRWAESWFQKGGWMMKPWPKLLRFKPTCPVPSSKKQRFKRWPPNCLRRSEPGGALFALA